MNNLRFSSMMLCASLLGCGASTELYVNAPPPTDASPVDLGTVPTDVPTTLADVVRPDAVAPDVVAPRPDVTTTGRTYDYALVQLTIDSNTSASFAHTGFNLDGRYSPAVGQQPADCDHRDFFSAIDPDQNQRGCTGGTASCLGGVDNQLPELASASQMLSDWRQQYTNQVANGTLTRLIRVEGVDSLSNDGQVIVSVFNGYPMFNSCRLIGTPGQSYAIDQASISSGSARVRYAAVIRNGRLILGQNPGATGNVFELPTPSFFGGASLNLYRFDLRVSLTPEGGSNGNLGGYALRADLVSLYVNTPQVSMYRSVIEGLISGLVDLQTGGSCDAPNGAIGIGMGFRLARATIQAPIVSGPTPGMCGSAP